jgi:hypothetical protein
LRSRDGEVVLETRERGRHVVVGHSEGFTGLDHRYLCELVQLSHELEALRGGFSENWE